MKNTFFFFLFLFILSCNDEPKQATLNIPETIISVPDNPVYTPVKKDSDYYAERYRSQVHFSPETMSMENPSGLVFFDNEYHLFYQSNPDVKSLKSTHWGHAVTRDMSHWQHLPMALSPDELGDISSGSVVMDLKNTTGFGDKGQAVMVAVFTQYDSSKDEGFQQQSLAYSLDKGRTWLKYEGNPVLTKSGANYFQDPKVFRDEERSQWIMILSTGDQLELYSSLDLKTWKKLSEWGENILSHTGRWEHPDLMKMKIQGTNDDYKWLLTVSCKEGGVQGGSGTQYFIGDFDGKTFTPDERFLGKKTHWVDYGRDNYGATTWSNVPYGNRFTIASMSNQSYAQDLPTKQWRGTMTLPRQWSLVKTNKGVFLRTFIDDLLGRQRTQGAAFNEPQILKGTLAIKSKDTNFDPSVSEYKLLFKKPEGPSKTIFGLRLYNDNGEEFKVGFDTGRNQFFTDKTKVGGQTFSDKFVTKRHYATTVTDSDVLDMHIVIDKTSCEFFAEGGFMAMTDIFFPNEYFNHVELFSEGGEVEISRANIGGLRSIW